MPVQMVPWAYTYHGTGGCAGGGTVTAGIPVEIWQMGTTISCSSIYHVGLQAVTTSTTGYYVNPVTYTIPDIPDWMGRRDARADARSFYAAGTAVRRDAPTPEERARQAEQAEADRAEAARHWAELERGREAARERALELMGHCLGEDQLSAYREHGWFEVTSSRGRRWRIRDDGQAGNVDLMPEAGEARDATYCAHPPGCLPDPDAHLAQALVLMADEDAFLRVANCQYRRAA